MAVNLDFGYVTWAVIALVGYSIFTPLAEVATQRVPSTVVALVANSMLAIAALVVVLLTNTGNISTYLTSNAMIYMVAAGLFLIVGILSYYQALAAGPISVVTPIYGMFLVGSSAIGIAFLGESLTLQKGVGIVLAVVAVYLTATG